MVGRLTIEEREPEHQQGFSVYQEKICGPRSLTAVELHAIPYLVDTFGLSNFIGVVIAAGNKAELSSPIRYVEVALEKQAKREIREAQEAVNQVAREVEQESVEPVTDERAREVLEKAAREGNVVAQTILEGE